MKLKLLILILLSLLCLSGFSQKSSRKSVITGIVQDITGSPIADARIMVDGKVTRSVTDDDGKYSVRIGKDATTIGIVTYNNGMVSEIIDGRKKIDFQFPTSFDQQNELAGNEAVNTGYGTIRKRDLTTPISKIDGADKKYASYSSVYDMIQRQSTGVRISNGDVIIQNSSNMSGFVPALLVVDGVYVNSISGITPSMVESIQILKGTSAAIYGSRGFGGAVVITTKVNF
jgi:TonB-dependent starch-binding outer membrane protein SusC